MKMGRVGASLRHLLAVPLLMLAPGIAHAGLLGDTVSASLTEVLGPTSIFTTGSAVVTVGGPEFQGTLLLDAGSTWTLDLSDVGFTLTGVCQDVDLGCGPHDLTLTISGLDFTPPATLVALSGITGDLASDAGVPQITASSVIIEFQSVELGTGAAPSTRSYTATFVTEQETAAVPLPATAALLAIGAFALSYRRSRARI